MVLQYHRYMRVITEKNHYTGIWSHRHREHRRNRTYRHSDKSTFGEIDRLNKSTERTYQYSDRPTFGHIDIWTNRHSDKSTDRTNRPTGYIDIRTNRHLDKLQNRTKTERKRNGTIIYDKIRRRSVSMPATTMIRKLTGTGSR